MAQSEHHHQARRHPHREPADGAAQPAANGATEGGDDGGAEIQDLQAQLGEERNRAEDYLTQWQRAAADFQNFKRRTEQEREETARLANLALVFNILPAVDDLDRALDTVDASIEASSWVEGIRQIQRKLKGALEASGVSEIRAEGEEFDPNIHEAISQAPGEHNRVVVEVRRGYRLGNRVVRPAMVVVGNGDQPDQS
jgi:molecular chaperone GrpE